MQTYAPRLITLDYHLSHWLCEECLSDIHNSKEPNEYDNKSVCDECLDKLTEEDKE